MVAAIYVLLSVVVGLFTYFFVQLEKKRRKYDQFGGPKSLPIVGNVHQMKRSPKEFTRQLYEWVDKYGTRGKFRIMVGYYPLVIICRPEEAEPLFNSNKHIDKSRDYEFLHPWLSTGLLTSTGDKWKIRRKLLTPTFHFKILHDFVHVFNDQTRVLLGKLKQHGDGKPYNIFNDITLCALDIICETAMGQSVNAQDNKDSEYVQAVYRASEVVFTRQRTPWYWPPFLFNTIGPGKQHDQCLKVMHDFTEKVIRERSEEFSKRHGTKMTMEQLLDDEDDTEIVGKKKRRAFLDMLLCASSEGQRLSFLDIREEVDTFMFEGHDTTAMASNWATHLIGTNPDVQKKVHEELDTIFGRKNPFTNLDAACNAESPKYFDIRTQSLIINFNSCYMYLPCLFSNIGTINLFKFGADDTSLLKLTITKIGSFISRFDAFAVSGSSVMNVTGLFSYGLKMLSENI